MKKFFFISTLLLILNSFKVEHKPLPSTMDYVKSEVSLLIIDVEKMLIACEDDKVIELQNTFKDARLHYKHVESLVEYYFPPTAEMLNGPAIDETEEYDDKINFAAGFQV